MAQRIKGQEVSILVVREGVLEAELTDIQNFNAELKLELLEHGYLGETTDRHDEIFKGAKFDFEMHVHSQDFITFAKAVLDRARRRQPDLVFNIVATFNFPNGQTPTWMFPDAKFGPIPMNVGSRNDYIKVKIDGAVDEPDMQES